MKRKKDITKIKEIVNIHPDEFSISPFSKLYCKICNKVVSHSKYFFVSAHRSTFSHRVKIESTRMNNTYLDESPSRKYSSLVKTFIMCDIPLYKLRSDPMKQFFKENNIIVPSETTARRQIEFLSSETLGNIKKNLRDTEIYAIIDEAQINYIKYINILFGKISNPNTSYLVATIPIQNLSSEKIIHCLGNVLKKNDKNRENFLLLLTDSASYMVSSTKTLKVMYPNLSHVFCLLHLLHNCAMRIKCHFPKVNKLISSVKASIVKNNTRKALFIGMKLPPEPIVTRWGSWLEAGIYYTENVEKVKQIIEKFEDDGIVVQKAKEAANDNELLNELIQFRKCYSVLGDIIKKFENKKLDIQDGMNELLNINFGEDPGNIKEYMLMGVNKNDIINITNLDHKLNIEPNIRNALMHAQSTTIDVERSFSMLGKLLRKDRGFKKENVDKYMILYYNKF